MMIILHFHQQHQFKMNYFIISHHEYNVVVPIVVVVVIIIVIVFITITILILVLILIIKFIIIIWKYKFQEYSCKIYIRISGSDPRLKKERKNLLKGFCQKRNSSALWILI